MYCPKIPHITKPTGLMDLMIVNMVEKTLPCNSLGIFTCNTEISWVSINANTNPKIPQVIKNSQNTPFGTNAISNRLTESKTPKVTTDFMVDF